LEHLLLKDLSSIYLFLNFACLESYYWKTHVVFNNKTALAELGKGLPRTCDVNDKESVFRAIRMVENLKKDEINKISNFLKEKYNWVVSSKKFLIFLIYWIIESIQKTNLNSFNF